MNHPNPTLSYAGDLDLLQMATSSLMTRFYTQGCPGVAAAVVHHLECLLEHPNVRSSPVASECYRALLEQWTGFLDRSREMLAKQRKLREQASPKPMLH